MELDPVRFLLSSSGIGCELCGRRHFDGLVFIHDFLHSVFHELFEGFQLLAHQSLLCNFPSPSFASSRQRLVLPQHVSFVASFGCPRSAVVWSGYDFQTLARASFHPHPSHRSPAFSTASFRASCLTQEVGIDDRPHIFFVDLLFAVIDGGRHHRRWMCRTSTAVAPCSAAQTTLPSIQIHPKRKYSQGTPRSDPNGPHRTQTGGCEDVRYTPRTWSLRKDVDQKMHLSNVLQMERGVGEVHRPSRHPNRPSSSCISMSILARSKNAIPWNQCKERNARFQWPRSEVFCTASRRRLDRTTLWKHTKWAKSIFMFVVSNIHAPSIRYSLRGGSCLGWRIAK